MFPDASGPVGGVGAYIRVVTMAGDRRALWDPFFGAILASGGVVDSNTPLRGQYALGGSNGPAFTGAAGFTYDAADAAAAAAAGYPYMAASMFVAPASALPANPTLDQIRLAATQVIRGMGAYGSPSTRTAAGSSDYQFIGAMGAMEPNKKYWVLVCPTILTNPANPATIANDQPFYGTDALGRAISLWTNRTPLAPVITNPVGQTTVFPGSSVTLRFQPKDPDRIQSYEGDTGIPDFEDMAGVQFQYRSRASDEAPAGPWADLPIANLTGQVYGRGWYFDDKPTDANNDGAYYAWLTRKLLIQCGSTVGFTANAAFLPAGDWEVRVRTFDYGHNRPDSANKFNPATPGSPPLNDNTYSYTPDNYPAVNTSPWSASVRIYINPQVPKPLALNPKDNIAVAYPANPLVETVDDCTSTTGWTGTMDGAAWPVVTGSGNVSITEFANPGSDDDVLVMNRTGVIDTTDSRYLIIQARVFSPIRNLIIRSQSQDLDILSVRDLGGNIYEYLVDAGDEVITELEFETTRYAAEAWAGLLIYDIKKTGVAPIQLQWQYRNTYSPPYAQATRTVQIRRIDEAEWTTLVEDQPSSSTSLYVAPTHFAFVSGNQYVWRVRVTDVSETESANSDPASFWVVPEPSSGEVIPVPSETTKGATLGCGRHRVFVYRRGGKRPVGELTGVTTLEWNRTRDDISVAKATIKDWSIDCGKLLSRLEPWAYELVIIRDNGFSKDRVWEGPITLVTYENDAVVVQAKDVFAYAYRRIIKQAVNDSGKSSTAGRTVVERAAAILQNIFAPDDPNLLAYMNVIVGTNDAKQYRNLPPYSRTGYEEIDDMAANAGLDYTAVGRAMLVWGTKHRIGTLPEFTDKDLGASPIVSVYGMSMANVYAVSDGNGVWGEADRLDEEGKDEKYGLVEMLSSTWASETEEEAGTYTEAGLNTVRESFAESAERSIASRYPPPVVVRVPDNTRVNPDTVISIQHLVPGVVIPLRSTGTLRTVVANQKLDAVKVVETSGEETITITLSPFSREDTDLGETE